MSRSRHSKPWEKPPKDFKRIYARIRRHQDKHKLKKGEEAEKHKKTDGWNYT